MNITEYNIEKKHNVFCLDDCKCQKCYNNVHESIFYAVYCNDCSLQPTGKSKKEFRDECRLSEIDSVEIDERVIIENKEKDIYHEPFETYSKQNSIEQKIYQIIKYVFHFIK